MLLGILSLGFPSLPCEFLSAAPEPSSRLPLGPVAFIMLDVFAAFCAGCADDPAVREEICDLFLVPGEDLGEEEGPDGHLGNRWFGAGSGADLGGYNIFTILFLALSAAGMQPTTFSIGPLVPSTRYSTI
jgi:hypothetical protein